MKNQYAGIAEYYDLWVTSGYYDYEIMAKAVKSIVGQGCQIVEDNKDYHTLQKHYCFKKVGKIRVMANIL